MRRRCFDENHPFYKKYGGNKISVCKRWANSFMNFFNDMGERKDNQSIDRINGKYGYFKSNCRWATREQQNNNKSTNVYISYKGIRKNVTEWSKFLGIKRETINSRICRKWSLERILLEKPSHKRTSKTRKLMASKLRARMRVAFWRIQPRHAGGEGLPSRQFVGALRATEYVDCGTAS